MTDDDLAAKIRSLLRFALRAAREEAALQRKYPILRDQRWRFGYASGMALAAWDLWITSLGRYDLRQALRLEVQAAENEIHFLSGEYLRDRA